MSIQPTKQLQQLEALGGVTLPPRQIDWYCPNCNARSRTFEVKPHVRMHACPKMGMLTAPMLEVGTKAKVERREREDYVGEEMVRLDENGRPVMSIVTTRDEGQDAIVFAPTAVAKIS